MIEACHFLVVGRVQGVGFRMFALEAALREGLSGYVRNLDDGSVEAVAEGDREGLQRFHAVLWRGPGGARVSNVEATSVPPTGRHTGFHVSEF
jgi:acylphosphatase